MQLPIPEFKVLLYGPGLPSAGVKARAHFEDSVLVVQGKGHWFTIQGDLLNLKTGGFDGRQWLLSWMTPSGLVTAMLQGDDAVQAFIKLAPAVISEQLKRLHESHGRKERARRLSIIFLTGFILLAVVSLSVFRIYAEELSFWAANQMTQEQKNQLGEMAFEALRPRFQWVERGAVRETVEFVGVRVLTGARNRYILHVAVSPQINSTALPGGRIIVNTGALHSVENANELAAMLAQAAARAETHNALGNLIHSLGWRAMLAAVRGDLSSSVWHGMAGALIHMRFTQAQEREADRTALAMLQRAGVSVDGLLPYLERIATHHVSEFEATKSGMSWVGKERLDALRKEIATLGPYPHHPLTVDWPLFELNLNN